MTIYEQAKAKEEPCVCGCTKEEHLDTSKGPHMEFCWRHLLSCDGYTPRATATEAV